MGKYLPILRVIYCSLYGYLMTRNVNLGEENTLGKDR